MDCGASRGKPEQGKAKDQVPGQGETGSGLTRSLPEPHTSLSTLSSLSRPPDPIDAALPGSALFPTRIRELVGVCVSRRALSSRS